MKKNKVYVMLAAMAGVFGLTACQDTDAQYEIPVVAAPDYVSVTPSTNGALLYGEKTIQVKFDKRINFMTVNTSQITLNGKPVKKALVLGADSTLTITADVSFDKTQKLHIPAGLIANGQGTPYLQDINLTWEVKSLPANEATAMTGRLGWGFNLGNHFDTSNMTYGYWDKATPTATLYTGLAAMGCKTVRMPATWTNHMDDNGVIDASYMDEVAQNVDWAIAAGLNVILNTHHDSFEADMLADASTNPVKAAEAEALIESVWTQIATKFADRNEQLIFETFNEVHAGDDWSTGSDAQFATLNQWNAIAVNAIRATGGNNSTRWIGVSGYACNIDMAINHLVLPADPANRIMVSVHCYDPGNFCQKPVNEEDGSLYCNSWGHNADPEHSNSGANEEYLINQLYKLRTNYIEKGIPCYIGEYGCVNQTTANANLFRNYYLEFFCRAAQQAGVPMFIWDNNAQNTGNECFGYVNHDDGTFIMDGASLIPMMVRAATSTDSSYDFYTIWNNSPVYVAE